MKNVTRPDAESQPCRPGFSRCLPLLGAFMGLTLVNAWDVRSAPAAEPGAPLPRKVDFNREVRPILAKNCFACHGQDEAKRAKGLRLDRRESAVKPLKSGESAIVPGDPESSALDLPGHRGRRDAPHAPREDGQPAQRRPRSMSCGDGSSKGPSTPSTGP